jgi:hypothetical protein
MCRKDPLVFAPCPRHNNESIHYLDYGNIDYHQDLYFDRFGGYDSFRALIYISAQDIYELLSGERFLPDEQVEEARNALDKNLQTNRDAIRKASHEYFVAGNSELEKLGFKMPDWVAEILRDEWLQRKKELCEKYASFNLNSRGQREIQLDISDSPMMQEVREILDGKWSGKPHWAIND